MNLSSRIEHQPMSRYQLVAITVCMVINMMDGFDVLVVAFTAPSIAADWSLSGTAIGTLLSAGLAGMTVGSLALGPLADRFGRRPLVLCSLAIISLGMLLSAFTQDVNQLALMRLLTGLGIGGILPSLNTIVAEYSSRRWRSSSVSSQRATRLGQRWAESSLRCSSPNRVGVGCMRRRGWHRRTDLRGVETVAESLDFLVTRQPRGALQQLNACCAGSASPRWRNSPSFPTGRAPEKPVMPACLKHPAWLQPRQCCACHFSWSCSASILCSSWTPKLLVDAGMSTNEGISGGVILNIGGIIGSLLLGYVSARIDISKLIAVYMLVTAALMLLFANVSVFDGSTLTLALALGFFIFGSMVGLYALHAHLYPVRTQAAGLAVAIGVGRIGGVLSPAAGRLSVRSRLGLQHRLYSLCRPLAAVEPSWCWD